MLKFYDYLLLENLTPSGELYHFTNLKALDNIIKTDTIKFLLSFSSEQLIQHKTFPYFLSTTRIPNSKYSNYNYPSKNRIFNNNVMISLDIHSLKKYGYPIKSVDYWGDNFKKQANFREEHEVRIYSKNPDLTPLSKYVNKINIYINPNDNNSVKNPIISKDYKFPFILSTILNNINNIYVYTDYDNFIYQNIKKSIPHDIILSQLESPPNPDTIYTKDSRFNPEKFINNVINLYKGKYDPPIKTFNLKGEEYDKYHILDMILHYHWESKNYIESQFHNILRNHPNNISEITNIMKINKLKTLSDFIDHFIAKVRKNYWDA